MKNDKKTEEKINIIFSTHPNAKEFHFTSDCQAFTQEGDARNHARDLEDTKVTLITRKMVVAGLQLEAETELDPPDESGAKNDFQQAGESGHDAVKAEVIQEKEPASWPMILSKRIMNPKKKSLNHLKNKKWQQ